MEEKKWKTPQENAITVRNKTVLVSAAAGSGKTAVLTERIIRRIVDESNPIDISKMLVVTFTKLAAEELKQRIYKALEEKVKQDPKNKRYTKQLSDIQNAQISTIDSFFYSIVKENYTSLSLPSSFRIGDEGELQLLSKNVMDECIERKYDSSDEFFPIFVECITKEKSEDKLSDILVNLYYSLEKEPNGIEEIKKFSDELLLDAQNDYSKSKCGKIIFNHVIEIANSYLESLNSFAKEYLDNDDKKIDEVYFELKNYLNLVIDSAKSGNIKETREAIETKLQDFPRSGYSLDRSVAQYLKELKSQSVKDLKGISDKALSFSEEEIKSIYERLSKIEKSLYSLYFDFEETLYGEKTKRHIFSFQDIVKFTLKLLRKENGEPTELALDIKKRYEEIYIDEYQDVDPIQDLIFRLVSREDNRFMVGDIKQSIYGFKGSDTKLFANYKNNFSRDIDNTKSKDVLIYMPDNFRSDSTVIDFSNMVFSKIFNSLEKSIGYNKNEDNLVCSKDTQKNVNPPSKVFVSVIEKPIKDKTDEAEDSSSESLECTYIANQIKDLLENGQNADGSKIKPSDIAIFSRKVDKIKAICDALNEIGISCQDTSKKNLFDTPAVLLTLSLLETINNPTKDIHLASTLISPFFNFFLDDLITIRKASDDSKSLYDAILFYRELEEKDVEISTKIEYFIKKLDEYRQKSVSTPINKLINFLYRDLNVFSYSETEKHNLIKLYEMSRKYESTSFRGLDNFLEYVEGLIEKANNEEASEIDPDSDCVKVMTIHKSKGLEFKVCFLAFCGRAYKEHNDKIKYNRESGLSFPLLHKNGFAFVNNPCQIATKIINNTENAEEEMRILYVALTRAKEKMFISGVLSSKTDTFLGNVEMLSKYSNEYQFRNVPSSLMAILSSFDGKLQNDFFVYKTISPLEIKKGEILKDKEIIEETIDTQSINELKNDLSKRLSFEYKNSFLNDIKAKFSVSKIYPSVLDEDDEVDLDIDKIDENLIGINEYLEEKSKKATFAEIGTATHLFMQFADFENAETNGIDAEILRLQNKGFITKKIAEIINRNQLSAFIKSDFYKGLKEAVKVYREQRFNILLDAKEFTKDENLKKKLENEKILVQGVIDLFYFDKQGEITLCDYKTDRLTQEMLRNEDLAREFLSERHKTQLSYYKEAIKKICKKEPKNVCIYSLPLGKAIKIEV